MVWVTSWASFSMAAWRWARVGGFGSPGGCHTGASSASFQAGASASWVSSS